MNDNIEELENVEFKIAKLKIEKVNEKHPATDTVESESYGFYVYRDNGYSLPKGFISSFYAVKQSKISAFTSFGQPISSQVEMTIRFAIQAPTGDASDHLNYTVPVGEWNLAKAIVDQWFNMCEKEIKHTNRKEKELQKMIIYPKQYLYKRGG